ncbi:ubiquitin-activating enzyme E1 [Nematocida sp. AWRm80]|nr:ubiquitin-activating enzyme E1 [Nematocida sp. AWRm80]
MNKDRVYSPKIDEGLYSRQIYVMGNDAMRRMLESNVLIIGLKTAGTEIAKNLALAGVRGISLYDASQVRIVDLGSAFYCTEADVKDRVDQSIKYKLKALNYHVTVQVLECLPSELTGYTAVILCDARIEEQIRINEECRRRKIPFISVRCKGLFFEVFCDFGESFVSTDENGEDLFIGTIKEVSTSGEVTLAEEERHGLEEGDEIEIKSKNPRRYKVKDPKAFKFSLEGYSGEPLAGEAFEQIKKHTVFSFKSLKDSLATPQIAYTIEGAQTIHNCFQILDTCTGFKESIDAYNKRYKIEDKQTKHIVHEFFRQPMESIIPIVSVAGGIAAHEALKACSGKFRPLEQFMYYHALEVLPPEMYKKYPEEIDPESIPITRYTTLQRIFGKHIDKIFNMNIFVVGSGAIGCEYLKNLAVLGAGKDNRISITDMDAIERSNLNRQFLFRETDISQMKSVVAAREAAVLNPDMNNQIVSYTSKADKDTEHIFNDEFYESVDIIMNALDNVEARLYIDTRAVYHSRPMIDAGTLGTKGHTQSVVPNVTEHYGNTSDPQEKSIPLCTIRNFPHLPVHCVEWALAEFKTLFTERIIEAKTAVESAGSEPIPDQIRRILQSRPLTQEDALKEAIRLFYRRFFKGPNMLLLTFPPNHHTEEGTPFWVPPKRMPIAITLDLNNQDHMCYIRSGYVLLAKTFCLEKNKTEDEIEQYASTERIAALNDQMKEEVEKEKENFEIEPELDLSSLHLQEEVFEKDSETNRHISFISSAANIRCANYSIQALSPLEVKKIAGRIIPAIATTTAVVSGLAVLEALKYIFWKDEPLENLEDIYKNNYVSLAIPLLTSSEPARPQTHTITLPKKELKVTHWTKIEIKDIPLEEILSHLNQEWGVDIPTVMNDLTMLYCSFYNQSKFKPNLKKRVSEILFPSGVPAGTHSSRIDAVVVDDNGNDLMVPFIKVLYNQ